MDYRTISRSIAQRPPRRNLVLLLTIAAIIPSFMIWAALTELDNITRGEGRLVAAAQNQIVQAGESGVLLRRYVEENDIVRAGTLLFELDPVDAASELEALLQRKASADIRRERLTAEITGAELSISEDLLISSPALATSERSLFDARRGELDIALDVLSQELKQQEQELAGARIALNSAANRSALIAAELSVVEPLVDENIVSTQRLLQLRIDFENAEAERAAAQTAIFRVKAAIQQVEREQEARRRSFLLRAQEELSAALAELSEMKERLPLLEERLKRTRVLAPVDGIVNRINLRTPGGYVSSGTALLEIVPTGEDLIVEVRIAPKDISGITLGDVAHVRFDAYDASRYGAAEGFVREISADAQIDPANPSLRYYTVRVTLEGRRPQDSASTMVRLLPGMTATVDVVSGKRSILDYIWQPVARVQELALRD